jgi:DNA-binding transcriptional MerR regulator
MTDKLTSRQAAEAFGVTVKTIHNWVAAGHLHPVERLNLTRQAYFDPAELREFARQRGITFRVPDKTQK